MKERIILGIDPGSIHMGFGILQETMGGQSMRLITYGVFQLKKHKEHMLRMRCIYTELSSLLQKHAPDAMAIETVFYGTNVQAMLKLGRAQGVAIAAALACEIPVIEYAPRKIKQAITGQGAASKEQVAAMVAHLLNLTDPIASLDASDALAVAICHSQQQKASANKITSWSQFVKTQPHRIIESKTRLL
ncbi:MAG: crossover junction endodeoxyribonuclease RuvC [Amoebophilaceae bacterium]|nr:crossover junction endodeoxyribonuclease RuvC [Amoebophilaceae bacterium]